MRYAIVILIAIFLAACGGRQNPWPDEEVFEPIPEDRIAPLIPRMYNAANMYCSQMFLSYPCTAECYYTASGWETTCEIWTLDEHAVLTCSEDLSGGMWCEDTFAPSDLDSSEAGE